MVAILNFKMTTVLSESSTQKMYVQPQKKNLSRSVEDLTYSGSSVGSPQTKAFHWGSVKHRLGSIGVVEASRMEVVLIQSAHLVLGAAFGSFPAMDMTSYREGGARAIYILHGGHIGFQNGRHQKLYLINPYFTSPTQL